MTTLYLLDDDGKPYMVIKNGQKTNRLQELGKDGQLTSSVIDLLVNVLKV